jgi:Ca2+-binding RTX toxin-like protein
VPRVPLLVISALLLLPSSAVAGVVSTQTIITDSKYGSSEPALFFSGVRGEANRITMARSPTSGDLVLHDAGALLGVGPGCVQVDAGTASCHATRAYIDAGDGDDTVTVPAIAPGLVSVRGGEGDDVLSGAGSLAGGPGADVLRGGDPCEQSCYPGLLAGGPGDDVLRGGAANELLSGDGSGPVWPAGVDYGRPPTDDGGGQDLIGGGAGVDTATYDDRESPVRIDLAARLTMGATGERDRLENIENATGGKASDVLLGDGAANVLEGDAGNDRVDGRGGDDYLLGNLVPVDNEFSPVYTPPDDGADRLSGGTGNDRLDAGGERGDALLGGPGNDELENASSFGETRVGTVRCGAGSDVVSFEPRGQLLSSCEVVLLSGAGISARPARRRGGLRFVGSCPSSNPFDEPCRFAVTIRVRSALVGRGKMAVRQRSRRALAVRSRRQLRRGDVLQIASSVRSGVGVAARTCNWRIRLR